MRKSILVGLGLAVSLAGAVAAQQPADSAHGRQHERHGKFERGRRGPMGGARGLLFKDIALTDAQKTQLKQLRESRRATMGARRDSMRAEFQKIRDARQKGDTVTARTLMAQGRQKMEQSREQELAAIRNILTPEQRVQFDKNVATLKQRAAERAARVGQRGPDGRRGHRGFHGKRGA